MRRLPPVPRPCTWPSRAVFAALAGVVHQLSPTEWCTNSQEHRREDDADEQTGEHPPHVDHRLGEEPGLPPWPGDAAEGLRAEQEDERTAHDRAREEETLDPADLDPHDLPDEQEQAQDEQGEPDGVRRHVTSLPDDGGG